MPLPWISIGSQPQSTPDLSTAGTILGRWKIEDVAGSADARFTSWADASGNSRTLNQVNVSGLFYRVAATGFGGLNAAECATAGADGIAAASQAFGATVSQPFTMVAFGKLNGTGSNGDFAFGNSTYYGVGKVAGSLAAGSSAGNGMFYSAQDTTVRVWTILYNGNTNSQLYWNATQNGSNGNLNNTAFSGEFSIGRGSAGNGLVSLWNEVAVFSGDVTSNLASIIMPYFRNKSGLALL